LDRPSRILALDVGSGTQDLLLWSSEEVMENCLQMVLPSPTRLLADRIRRATRLGKPVHLEGVLMGGGPLTWAVQDHIASGYPVSAEPRAALTLHDNMDRVRSMGVSLRNSAPPDAMTLKLGDIQMDILETVLKCFDLEPPEVWCIAVQDHGYQPEGSNRVFRFKHWRRFLESGGEMASSIYRTPPSYLTRMIAVLEQAPGAWVMDTGMAAIHGALCDPWVRRRLEEGVIVVNLGNQHALAAMVKEDRVLGLWEHHTGALTQEDLVQWMNRFARGEVRHQEVLESGGHGCAYRPEFEEHHLPRFFAVTGPRRALAEGLSWHMAAPFGNMMLAGCYGLIRAYHLAQGWAWPA